MEGKTPAPWFVEVEGQKQGPYTSQQIMQLLMDGALKVESKIFDSVANTWKSAADVIPYLEINVSSESAESARAPQRQWSPPPRPVQLRDVHIVDLNQERTGDIDYFALLNHHKRQSERNRAAVAARTQTAPVETPQATTGRRFTPTSRAQSTASRRAEPGQVVRVAPPPVEETPKPGAAIRIQPTSSLQADGILVAEPEGGKVLDFVRRAGKTVKTHKKGFAAAAALAFVFVGSYGVIRSFNQTDEGRQLATATENATTNPNVTPPQARGGTTPPPVRKPRTAKKAPVGRHKSGDPLGRGRHRVSRQSGVASLRNAPAMQQRFVPKMPEQSKTTSNDSRNEPLREAPQFISTRDMAEQEASPPPVTPQQQAAQKPAPDNGVVDPPGFIPPPQDPNQDPSRVPTNDPNAQAPQDGIITQ